MKKYGWRAAARLLTLALLGVLLPACGSRSSGGGNPGGGPPPPSGPLFSDDFSADFPGTRWALSPTSGNGATAQIDASAGHPAPCLSMTASQEGSFVGYDTNMTFDGSTVTFTVELAVPSDGEGSGGIALLNMSMNPLAQVEWHPSSPGAITFWIQSSGGDTVGVFPPAPSDTFHTFKFTLDNAGHATWFFDGSPVMSKDSFPSGRLSLRIYDLIPTTTPPTVPTAPSPAPSFATFRFDNITVTSP